MMQFVENISIPFVAFVFVIAAGLVALVAIIGGYRASRRRQEIDVHKFDATVDSQHRERMASLAATRDAEIAKYTGKKPETIDANKRIEG